MADTFETSYVRFMRDLIRDEKRGVRSEDDIADALDLNIRAESSMPKGGFRPVCVSRYWRWHAGGKA